MDGHRCQTQKISIYSNVSAMIQVFIMLEYNRLAFVPACMSSIISITSTTVPAIATSSSTIITIVNSTEWYSVTERCRTISILSAWRSGCFAV